MKDLNKSPWRTLTSRTVYQNDWIRVREDQVIRPDGQPGIYGVVEYHPCVGVLPIDAEGNVHLVGQFRYPLNQYSWEIPEGGCHVGESPLAAAHRELKEELGIIAGKLEQTGISHLSNSVSDERATLFFATDLTHESAAPDGTEDLAHRVVPFQTALELVINGEITDSMTQIAILLYANKMRDETAGRSNQNAQ